MNGGIGAILEVPGIGTWAVQFVYDIVANWRIGHVSDWSGVFAGVFSDSNSITKMVNFFNVMVSILHEIE